MMSLRLTVRGRTVIAKQERCHVVTSEAGTREDIPDSAHGETTCGKQETIRTRAGGVRDLRTSSTSRAFDEYSQDEGRLRSSPVADTCRWVANGGTNSISNVAGSGSAKHAHDRSTDCAPTCRRRRRRRWLRELSRACCRPRYHGYQYSWRVHGPISETRSICEGRR